jgi:pimeloyl-ACP methyl ester carboxylesterase
MSARVKVALAMLSLIGATLAAPAIARAEAPAIEQSAWPAMKKKVTLANGITLAYVELGNPQGPPLLLLHGYTDSSRTWSLLAPYLGKYRLLIPDQRGHGASDSPECCYSPAQYAFDARLFLDKMEVERANVVGHSMGSMVAIHMAAEYPERVTSIGLIGSTAMIPVKRGDWMYDSIAGLKWPLDPAVPFMRDWHPANQPTPVDPVFAEAVRAEYMTMPRHVWRGVMRELASVPIGRHASDVKVPVLILSGGKDPIFTAEHHASLLKAFPNAEAEVYAELGHNPNWERPADIARRIAAFLEGVE